MRILPRIDPKYWLIAADLLADLGNQFVHMILLDRLIFRGENGLAGLAAMCVIEQSPSIFLSRFAGRRLERAGGKRWLIGSICAKWLLICVLLLSAPAGVVFSAYLSFIVCSVFFQVGRLFLPPTLMPGNELVAFNALNERVSLAGRIFGPAVIGVIVSGSCPNGAAIAGGVLFAMSALAIQRVPCPEPEKKGCRNGKHENHEKAGPRGDSPDDRALQTSQTYKNPLRGDKNQRDCFALFGFALFAGGILNIGLPILFKARFESAIADWGLIISGSQLGSCLATMILPRLASRFGRRAITSGAFVALGAAMALLGQESGSLVRITALMSFFSFGLTLIHVYTETLIQQNSSKLDLAGTVSFLMAYKSVCYLGTILGGAAIIGLWGTRSLLAAGAIALLSAPLLVRT